MIGKLFKNEILRTWRWLLAVVLAAALVVGTAVWGALVLRGPVSTLLGALALLAAIAFTYAVPLLISLDFYRSCYSKTGYFTAAIPAKGSTIFRVKALHAYLVTLISLLLGAGLMVPANIATGVSSGVEPRETLAALGDALSILWTLPPGILAVLVFAVLVLPVVFIAPYFFAATVGSEAWINRSGFGGVVLVWFLYYLGNQALSVAGIFIPPSLDLSKLPHLAFDFDPLALINAGSNAPLVPIALIVIVFAVPIAAMWWAQVSYSRRLELR